MSLVDDVSMARSYRAKRAALWDAICSHPRASTWVPSWCAESDVAPPADANENLPRAFEALDEQGALVRVLARRVLTSAAVPPCTVPEWARYQVTVRNAWEEFLTVRKAWAAAHTGLTVCLLKRYRPPVNAYDDLVQDGHEGLLQALDKYNPDHGARFCTYAAWWIRKGILDGIERSREVRIPDRCVRLLRQITRASEAIAARGDRPTPEAIAAEVGAPLDSVEVALRAPRLRSSSGLGASSDVGNPESVLRHAQLVDRLRQEAERLDERERRVITRHFGLEGGTPRTLREVGSELGMTGERARQIQVSGLRRLERALAERMVAAV